MGNIQPPYAPLTVVQKKLECSLQNDYWSLQEEVFRHFRTALCICQCMIGIDKIPQRDMNVPVSSC